MNDHLFKMDYDETLRKLTFHKKLGSVLRAVTLGLVDNSRNISKRRAELDTCRADLEQYRSLTAEAARLDSENEAITIQGVRVSRHVFSDLPVVGGDDYGIDWGILRDTILSRDDHECQEADGYCDGPLQIHHVTPLSKGGRSSPNNLVTLCLYHHSLRHPHMQRGQYGNLRG